MYEGAAAGRGTIPPRRWEAAGLDVRLVHPLEAKKRMAGRNKTDTIDATGLAMLLRNGTLPEV